MRDDQTGMDTGLGALKGATTHMQSDAPTVDEYLKEIPEKRFSAMIHLGELCLQCLKGFEESMEYGMPSYSRDDTVEVTFASQKNNISLYILKQDVLDDYRDQFPKSAFGKGCIRYRNPDKINFPMVEEMLLKTVESSDNIC